MTWKENYEKRTKFGGIYSINRLFSTASLIAPFIIKGTASRDFQGLNFVPIEGILRSRAPPMFKTLFDAHAPKNPRKSRPGVLIKPINYPTVI